jgi:hypothetical protein
MWLAVMSFRSSVVGIPVPPLNVLVSSTGPETTLAGFFFFCGFLSYLRKYEDKNSNSGRRIPSYNFLIYFSLIISSSSLSSSTLYAA